LTLVVLSLFFFSLCTQIVRLIPTSRSFGVAFSHRVCPNSHCYRFWRILFFLVRHGVFEPFFLFLSIHVFVSDSLSEGPAAACEASLFVALFFFWAFPPPCPVLPSSRFVQVFCSPFCSRFQCFLRHRGEPSRVDFEEFRGVRFGYLV